MPSGKLCRYIDLPPFWVVAGLEQRLEPSKKRLDKVYKITVAVGSELQISSREHSADRYGVDRLVRRHEAWLILSGEPRRDLNGGHGRFEGYGKEVEAVLTGNVTEERRWFPGDERDGSDLALAELLERHLVIIVEGRHWNI